MKSTSARPCSPADIARQRLSNSGLATAPFGAPAEAVHWHGAVQAQELPLAKWSLAQRCAGSTAADVDAALASGAILRTHVLRPTWHFVHAQDIRWLLELTAPRVHAMAAYRRRQLGIDATLVTRATAVIVDALAEAQHRTRRELALLLRAAGVDATGEVMGHLMLQLELDAIVCSGVPRGWQQTYALLEERAPDAAWLPREEALAELTVRFFRSHGPATVRDFAWWSSLSLRDIKAGLALAGDELASLECDGRVYWHDPTLPLTEAAAPLVQLVQQYDEILVGYTESRDVMDGAQRLPRGATLTRAVLLDGQFVGRWQRAAGAPLRVELETALDGAARAALEHAVRVCERLLLQPVEQHR